MWRSAITAVTSLSAVLTFTCAHAQGTKKVYRVASILTSATAAEIADRSTPQFRAYVQALGDRGYVDGRNLILDRRTAEGAIERIPEIVAELVRLKTDVIVVQHIGVAQVVAKVTSTVPIISAAGDPVMRGLAKSLNKPGGNVTGIFAAGGITVEQKRLELLRTLVPGVRRVAFVATRAWWDEWMGKAMQAAASTLGIQVVYIESKNSGFDEAFANVRREKPDAVFFEASPTAFALRAAIGEFAVRSRIPSACGHQELVESGCLMTYNFLQTETTRVIVDFVDRILKGTKAGDLPFYQYNKYEFAINAKTAKAIGLSIPQSALLRADRVIE